MMMKASAPVLFLLTLAACAGASSSWMKSGATEVQIRADQQSCRASAERSGGRNLDVTRDIRGGSISGGRDDTRAFVESSRDIKAARSFDRLFVQCMRSLGYVKLKI